MQAKQQRETMTTRKQKKADEGLSKESILAAFEKLFSGGKGVRRFSHSAEGLRHEPAQVGVLAAEGDGVGLGVDGLLLFPAGAEGS